MPTATISKKEYKKLLQRQEKVESDLRVLKEVVKSDVDESRIRPTILKRWERISRALDRGRGRSFVSEKEMKNWLVKI